MQAELRGKILFLFRTILVVSAFGFTKTFSTKVTFLFAQSAAKFAASFLLLNAPVISNNQAMLEIGKNDCVIINSACSGTTFFAVLFASMFWVFSGKFNSFILSILSFVAFFFLSFPLTIFINSIRICMSILTMKLSERFLDVSYQPIVHMLTGGICFFTFLLIIIFALNFITDYARNFKKQI